MSRWVDFAVLKRGVDIEQVLAWYHLRLQRVGRHSLWSRAPCSAW